MTDRSSAVDRIVAGCAEAALPGPADPERPAADATGAAAAGVITAYAGGLLARTGGCKDGKAQEVSADGSCGWTLSGCGSRDAQLRGHTRGNPQGDDSTGEQFARRCLGNLRHATQDVGGVDNAPAATAITRVDVLKRHDNDDATQACPETQQITAYCANKLKQLRDQRRDDARGDRKPQMNAAGHRKAKSKSNTVQLPAEFKRRLNRMRIENLLHNLSEACKVQLHDPDRCRKCSKRLSEESKERFLQRHRARLQSALDASRYESHLIRSAPVAAIGEIAQGLPKLTDPPATTWALLMNTAEAKK